MFAFVMFTQPLAMVADDDDQRPLPESVLVKIIDEPPDLPIGESDAGVVRAVGELRAKQFFARPVGGMGVKQMDPAEERTRRAGIQPGQSRIGDELSSSSALDLPVREFGPG